MKDKIVVVTGAAGGLGKAFAEAFSNAGAKVAVCDKNIEGAKATANALTNAIAVEVDITNAESLKQMTQTILDTWGGIDVLVNNAAVYAGLERKPFYEISEKEWDLVMNVNVKGLWMVCKSVVPVMMEKKAGKIVNVASATFMSGSPNWSHYVASKGAVIGFTRSIAKELGDYNINVNAIAPGFTLTQASLDLMENAQQYGVNRGAIKRPSSAEDIVGTALYLASSGSDFVTGQTIVVDGGKQFI
ncbi:SDR family NAD(P)-dependent oxidoreductase [Maribacter sp. 4G9]|uniref:SDR family NAD(P)-dependent oxidoreductase n=1 Tax=Maribacter sp. 4G9 TaxID=1889777 RepID=UPI000C15143F|nr:glucose 1-dehydrogenase [Maribacter sp. 4G9]PIB27568.1 dehydrogenase [Maribacter sp. 4G9]